MEKESPAAAHWSEQSYRAAFDSAVRARIVLLAESGDRLQGFLIARFTVRECELENIVVAGSERRHGIASLLLKNLIAAARLHNVAQVWLEVRESNAPARSLYAKIGFTETGRRRRYYDSPVEDAVLFTLSV